VKYIRRARLVGASGVWVYATTIQPCGSPVAEKGIGTFEQPLGFAHTLVGAIYAGAGDAAAIEAGRGFGYTATTGLSTVTMLVADGVASVVLRYPAGKIGGFDRHHARAVTLTAQVVGNVVVVPIPRNGMRLLSPMTMTWRSARGAVVKTFRTL
jgi:hypothetical protein